MYDTKHFHINIQTEIYAGSLMKHALYRGKLNFDI